MGRALLALSVLLLASTSTSTFAKQKAPAVEPEDACVGSRILSIVAHADDDLYFINPAIDAAIARGACVHTVIVTAGYVDEPDNSKRLAGLKAAYSFMAQRPDAPARQDWQEQWLLVAGKPVQRLTLAGQPKIQLSFLHLPCGAHDDIRPRQPATLYELYTEHERSHTIGPQAGVDYDEIALVAVLKALINDWDPDTLYTLQPNRPFPVRHSRPGGEGAHPDHVIVARLVLTALIGQPRVRVVRLHDDYPIQDLPANLSIEQATRKTEVMRAYCREDVRGCANPDTLQPACRAEDADGWGEAWLCRHYPQRIPNRD
ncbi:hypothetical protein HPT27_06470 [Permianibacter sp. IMCC34836]|uniref:PIG-L family deacetylase n=1 Tax=Permianibacter fluminis TaxID=2738515 RepID=UPI00155235A3|nr:PIG-L family deacetylase [Permianibacter fluminis]NQD36663.1 hypothetical protein [Permianibacter fluminis]